MNFPRGIIGDFSKKINLHGESICGINLMYLSNRKTYWIKLIVIIRPIY